MKDMLSASVITSVVTRSNHGCSCILAVYICTLKILYSTFKDITEQMLLAMLAKL